MNRIQQVFGAVFNTKTYQINKEIEIAEAVKRNFNSDLQSVNSNIINEWFYGNNRNELSFTDANNKSSYLKAYKSLISACIKARAHNVANSKPILYEVLNQTERKEIVTSNPVIEIINQPNPNDIYSTWYNYLEITTIQQDLLGNCYWSAIRNKSNNVIGFEILPTQFVDISISNGYVNGYYLYKGKKNERFFPKEDIIHFSYNSPYVNEAKGMGLIEEATFEIDSYNSMNSYQKNLFQNDGRVNAVLQPTVDNRLSSEERERIVEQWNQKQSGTKNAGKINMLPNGIEYKSIQTTPKELDYNDGNKRLEDRILMMFSVPRGMLGNAEDVNKSSIDGTLYAFTQKVVNPLLTKINAKLNAFIRANFGKNLLLDHLPDLKADIEELKTLVEIGAISPEEARVAAGWKTDKKDTMNSTSNPTNINNNKPTDIQKP